MDKNTSLYQMIAAAAVNGELPEDFSLPQDTESENGLPFADGAMDGITVYHMAASDPGEESCVMAEKAVRAASDGLFETADDLFLQLGRKTRALLMIDALQPWVMEHRHELNAQKIWEYACHALYDARDKECVKFGMSLLELFQTADEPTVRKAVCTLGLSDEFTLFSVFIMQKWPDGNEEIWHLAQKVHGWGRIHAVDRLEPETEAIREWLMTEGVRNSVMYAYSALTCWQKANVSDVLKGSLTREQFSGIRDIFDGLLDEGPVQGISAIENADEDVLAFLRAAQQFGLTAEDFDTIRNIGQHYEDDKSSNPEIMALCQDLLRTDVSQ